MSNWDGSIERRIHTGEAVAVGNVRLVPEARSWVLRGTLFGLTGMLLLHSPRLVHVEEDGRAFTVPIPDVTGTLVWTFRGAAAFFLLVGFLRTFRSRD